MTDFIWADPVSYDLPPHFPDPNADPIALLEAALVEKDEIIAAQYREMTAWKTKLTEALAFVRVAHEQNDNMRAQLASALARVSEMEDVLEKATGLGGAVQMVNAFERTIWDKTQEISSLTTVILNLSPGTRKKAFLGTYKMSLAELRERKRVRESIKA